MQKQQNTTATAKPFWLYGKISRDQAEKLLTPKKPGKFVVRESTNYRGDFTLSVVRYDLRVEHYRIQRRVSYPKPVKFTIDEESYFESLRGLVKHYQEDADGICARLENISLTKPANERVQTQETPHRYLLTAAIDFGTTYSGYAYAHHAEEKGTIHVNANWKSGSQSFKVPTAILFDEQKNFLSFGFAAEDEYTEFADSEEEMKYFLFHRFKMVLYEEKDISRDIIMKSQNGKTMLAIDVFAAAIKFLKEHLIRSINDMKYGEEVTAENVKWVLTVPAIWSSTARHFMTEAASKAGIEEKHLLIALEPECASVYCMNLPIGKLAETVDMNRKGCRYMVVDIGGGTVDITMHEIIGENQILELHKATGNDSGGTKVDKEFEQYLSKIFTENVVDTIKRNSPSEWLEMERDFEATKRSVGKEADKETTILLLKPCLHEAYEEIENISLVKAVKEKKINHKNATLQGKNRLRVPSSDFKDMILTVASNIKNFVHDLLNNDSLPRMDYVVLVGGFSKSELVLSEIRKIAGKIPVVRPPEAELAVVKGAVLFGQNPNLVTSRKSRRTYGIDVTRKFLATDPEELAITDEYGEIRCQKCFDPLVTVNETVKTGEVRYRSFYPFKSVDSVMPIRIYATNRENVRYCNEKDVLHVATFDVKLAKVTGENKREVKCEFHFGETTMRVDAIDVTSGHSCMETVDFLSERS